MRPTDGALSLNTVESWRRSDGHWTLACLVVIYLLVPALFFAHQLWLVFVLGFVVGAFIVMARLNFLRYRAWDRRITAMTTGQVLQSVLAMNRSGVYTEAEASQALTEYMRGIE